jgi:L-methionine (R)-S-oxide reductase
LLILRNQKVKMAEQLFIPKNKNRTEVYEAILPQIKELVSAETDLIANLANVSAALKEAFGFFWVGFYLDNKQGELVLGPFQGPIACTRIAYNRGVCGHSFTLKNTIIVPDVVLFPGHIACSSASKSEIVIPLLNLEQQIIGVLDIDSDELNDFSDIDQKYLEQILSFLEIKVF